MSPNSPLLSSMVSSKQNSLPIISTPVREIPYKMRSVTMHKHLVVCNDECQLTLWPRTLSHLLMVIVINDVPINIRLMHVKHVEAQTSSRWRGVEVSDVSSEKSGLELAAFLKHRRPQVWDYDYSARLKAWANWAQAQGLAIDGDLISLSSLS
ncbi:hypothetical protein TNCV_2052351 [Trichonephila clavipes]|nr:hypothetical protein TNCV_2052351 [Trichonephila clavipes]